MPLPNRLLGNRIIVRPHPRKEMTETGIHIPQSVQSILEEGTVIQVSDKVGSLLVVGERVLYPGGAGIDIEYDGVKYKYLAGPTLGEMGDVWAII